MRKQRSEKCEWHNFFLAALRNSGNVRAACQSAGISREIAYRHKRQEEEFAAQWEEAQEESVDVLEAEARRRAMASSDTLMIFLLKSNRPEKYRETSRHEITGAEGGPVDVRHMTDEQLAQIAAWAGDAEDSE